MSMCNNRYLLLIPFAFLFFSCHSSNQKIDNPQKMKHNVVINAGNTLDSIFTPHLIDTSLVFSTTKDLFDYQRKKYKEFWELSETLFSKGKSFNVTRDQYDSLRHHNSDLFYFLLFKYIKHSEKNLIDLRALSLIFENAFEIPEIDKMEVYNSFPEELRKSPDGIEAINNRDLFKKNIGSSIQEFSNIIVTNQENQRIKFLDLFQRKYEFYLLIFGASWCKPCRYENRFLKNSITLIDTTKVKIYNFSGDYNREKWLKSVKEDNCPWESFRLENGFQSSLIKSLNFISVPRNFLINDNLIIIKEHTDIKIIMKMIS